MFKDINKVVRTLVIADFFYNSAFASFGPVFAIFIVDNISRGAAEVVGFATAVYWLTKSLVQLPIARFLDKTDGERDDFWAMFFGFFLSSFVPIAYLFAKEPWHLYVIQAAYGFVMAWAVPAWYGIFTRHVDKWRISFEWSLESVFSVGLAAAGAAALGGYIVDRFGFEVLLVAASVLSFAASLVLLGLRRHLVPRRLPGERVMPERRQSRV
ncbi:MAG: MFS transporter [Parcubacteria group bacterium]|nr:MFS transporter [Parcubacteria group bacterium]